MKPLQDRIVVKRVDSETKTPGGLFIPETAKEKSCEGIVVSFGPGKRGEDGKPMSMVFQEGDRVLFSKYGAVDVKVDGQEYLILREDDVLAVLASN